ncbi:ribosome biogenesis GTP-binding protein YihA/YsxC [Flexithrix dorotheae]|uniref:ribosome biogenesis GTP-binding protein YihA/YsxC n=1 Tax=Flexithrix dorotheae TaxID=70993 RepID=UPI000367F0F9|nr:ribosome biogenesis GTP-binding protein YihA/YsxC [Flexithrix dorotheae]
MKIPSARFLVSNSDYKKCPKPDLPEYAFIGRSNVGKSSLINALFDNKTLAKTSSKPGKTQLINHFLINEEWYLVDLPGYGYAKVSKSVKAEFQKIIYQYLEHRENLQCVFVLVDIRIPPQKIDLEFMEWLGKTQIPFSIIFTKADKLKKGEKETSIARFKEEFLKSWEFFPDYFVTSSNTKTGMEDIFQFITEINQGF